MTDECTLVPIFAEASQLLFSASRVCQSARNCRINQIEQHAQHGQVYRILNWKSKPSALLWAFSTFGQIKPLTLFESVSLTSIVKTECQAVLIAGGKVVIHFVKMHCKFEKYILMVDKFL